MSRPALALLPLLLTLLSALLLREGALACSNVTSLSQALDTALAEYDREGAPARPVRVRATFDVRHAALRHDATVHVLGDLTLEWDDPRIAWNASSWGCDSVLVSSDRLWLPDVALANGAGGREDAATTARLRSAGAAAWVLRYDAYVPLALDLTAWPSDRQTAVFKFASRAHTADELDLEVSEVEHIVIFEAGAWELLSMTGAREQRGGRVAATYTAVLRRRAAAHAAAARAVFAAALLLLLAAAALPPLARPPLCACASFISAIWLATALLRLPAAASAPASLTALCVVCAAGGAAGAAAALAARAARCSSSPPRAIKSLTSSLSALCRITPLENTSASGGAGAWAAPAALLDRALRAALLLTLLVALLIYL